MGRGMRTFSVHMKVHTGRPTMEIINIKGKYIMASINRCFEFFIGAIVSLVLVSCDEQIGDGASLRFSPTGCDQIHIAAKCDRNLSVWIRMTGAQVSHDLNLESLISDYMSSNYGISGGSAIRNFYYCLEKCVSIKVENEDEDLTRYFQVTVPSDYYAEELVMNSEAVIGRVKPMPVEEFLSYEPFMLPVMLLERYVGMGNDFSGQTLTVTIGLGNGKEFCETVSIP